MAGIGFPVPNVPIVDGKTVSREWRWFFHDLLQRAGGQGDTTGLFTSDIGGTVQAWDADLDAIAALSPTDSNFIVGNGTAWVAEAGATARTSLGLGTLATQNNINNDDWSGADLAVANGGTGSSTASAARTALGLVIGTDVLANVVEDLTPQLGGDLDLNGKNIDFPTTANISDCLDDDTMATASAVKLATSESIKAYVDAGGQAGTGATPFSGARVTPAADELTVDVTTQTPITLDAEDYDIGGWHDNSVNNTRLTVPAGVTKVELNAQLSLLLADTNEWLFATITKNGVVDWDGSANSLNELQTNLTPYGNLGTGVVEVVEGDYFEFEIHIEADTSITINAERTSFSIKAVETTQSGKTATVQTTNATQTVLVNGAMAADSAHTIRAYGQGREDATGDTYHFSILGGARNEGGTSSVATPNVIEVTDAGASTWDATVTANDSTDVWEIKVTGEASHTIDWTVTYFEIIQ